jgi:hypothetical protein
VFGFGRSQIPASPELGVLGTHAWVVTDWMPGPTTPPRVVNMGDAATEPLRRTRSTKGPLVLSGDQSLPTFQGENAPPPLTSQDVTAAALYLDAYAASLESVGYPS